MSAPSVSDAIEPFARRRRFLGAARGARVGAWVGVVCVVVSAAAGRFAEFPSVVTGIAAALASIGIGCALGYRRSPSPLALCSVLDADLGLDERIRTAFETEIKGDGSRLAALLRADAVARLRATAPETWMARRVPRSAWAIPLGYGAAVSLFLVVPGGERLPPTSESERVAVRRAVESLRRSPMESRFRASIKDLERARSAQDALVALADAETRLRAESPATDALVTARETVSANAPSVADALESASPNLSNALRDELAALRERLGRNPATESLRAALEGIETREVTAQTLERIVAALREVERQSDSALLAALDEIRAQKQAIAAVALESANRNTARLDATPGQESDDSEAVGRRLAPSLRAPDETALTLDAAVSNAGRETRVYSKPGAKPSADGSSLLPFRQALLASRQEAERIARDEAFPAAYRTRVAAYFETLNRAARAQPRREELP